MLVTAGGTRGVGIGGLITWNGFGAAGAKASLVAAPWTIGMAVVSTGSTVSGGPTATFARSGFAHGPASGTTSTARRGGVVQLVTPLQIATSIGGVERIGFIAQLTLVFVPEPGTALLLGAGITVLALQSRGRRGLHGMLKALRSALEGSKSARRVRWSMDVDPIELF